MQPKGATKYTGCIQKKPRKQSKKERETNNHPPLQVDLNQSIKSNIVKEPPSM